MSNGIFAPTTPTSPSVPASDSLISSYPEFNWFGEFIESSGTPNTPGTCRWYHSEHFNHIHVQVMTYCSTCSVLIEPVGLVDNLAHDLSWKFGLLCLCVWHCLYENKQVSKSFIACLQTGSFHRVTTVVIVNWEGFLTSPITRWHIHPAVVVSLWTGTLAQRMISTGWTVSKGLNNNYRSLVVKVLLFTSLVPRPFEGEEEKGPGTYWLRMCLNYRDVSRNLTVHAQKTTAQTLLSLGGKYTRTCSLRSNKNKRHW